MKKLPILFAVLLILSACGLDPEKDTWEYYKDWREEGQAWLAEQLQKKDDNGQAYYQKVTPEYDMNAYVLIHYFNDRNLTKDNLSPLSTSTCDVKYKLYLHDGSAIDSSYLQTSPADSIFRCKFTDVISGFRIALMAMNVGDSCDVIIPYQQGYQNTITSKIKPYSNLRYTLKLVDIYKYEN